MARHVDQLRVTGAQGSQYLRQLHVLWFGIRGVVSPLELNANGIVIASHPVPVGGGTGMPGTTMKRDVLRHRAITRNTEVGRHALPSNLGELGVRTGG